MTTPSPELKKAFEKRFPPKYIKAWSAEEYPYIENDILSFIIEREALVREELREKIKELSARPSKYKRSSDEYFAQGEILSEVLAFLSQPETK